MKRTFATAFAFALVLSLQLSGCVPFEQVPEQPPQTGQQAAVKSLLAYAQAAMDINDYNQAEMHMERAVSIEPQNPLLWHTMAKIKFNQNQYGQAVNFCLKSNSMITDQLQLKRDNLELMARAYYMMGEYEKAEFVKQQLLQLENRK